MSDQQKTITVVIGAPCSGKTTYINDYLLPGKTGVEVFDLKELRNLGRVIRYLKAAVFEKKGEVIVEGHFPQARDRRKLVEFAYDNDYMPKVVFVNTSLDCCLDWNRKREEGNPGTGVSPRLIKTALAEIERPTHYEGFASVVEVKQNQKLEEGVEDG